MYKHKYIFLNVYYIKPPYLLLFYENEVVRKFKPEKRKKF